jgi:hypothetical protein
MVFTSAIILAMELNVFEGSSNTENVSIVSETDGRSLVAEEASWSIIGTWLAPARPLLVLVAHKFRVPEQSLMHYPTSNGNSAIVHGTKHCIGPGPSRGRNL